MTSIISCTGTTKQSFAIYPPLFPLWFLGAFIALYFSLHLLLTSFILLWKPFFFSPHPSKYFDTFFEPFQTEESELHAVFEVQLNHGFTEYLNNTLFFAIHSFPNNSKPEATFSEWSEMVSRCCHLGQCQHHVLEQKQSVQSSSFYLRFFGPRVHDLD